MRSGIFIILMLQISVLMAAEQTSLGRLFTTPAERERLDAVRKTVTTAALQAQEEKKISDESDAVLLPAQISMQGFVKRSDGKKSTFWVNHHAVQENSENADVQIGNLNRNNKPINLKLKKNSQVFNLKPGQIYLPNENQVVGVEIRYRER